MPRRVAVRRDRGGGELDDRRRPAGVGRSGGRRSASISTVDRALAGRARGILGGDRAPRRPAGTRPPAGPAPRPTGCAGRPPSRPRWGWSSPRCRRRARWRNAWSAASPGPGSPASASDGAGHGIGRVDQAEGAVAVAARAAEGHAVALAADAAGHDPVHVRAVHGEEGLRCGPCTGPPRTGSARRAGRRALPRRHRRRTGCRCWS